MKGSQAHIQQEANTTAHQKCRQSFSPNRKAHIQQEGNTTAHQKCRQSLSPDTKARIQEGNTTTHHKRRQSLSPDTKAHMLKIHAENNENTLNLSYPIQKLAFRKTMLPPIKKIMTEEEKKIEVQMKKYAGILPKAIDIDQTTVEFLRENFYKHPTLALTYYQCCSIDPRASIWNDELGTDIDKSTTSNCIFDLIGESCTLSTDF